MISPRLALVCALAVSAPALALEAPLFSTGGFLLSVQYGGGFWLLDRANLASQVGDAEAALYVEDAKNTHTVDLRAAYNIKGHASVLVDFSATGWNLSDPNRGGGGFLIGGVAWHPLELVWMKKQQRPLPIDASTWFGVGYGIAGQRRGMDGFVLQWGLDATYFVARYFGLGFFLRDTFLKWGAWYIDYYGRDQAGNTVPLPKGSGGAFLHLGLQLVFRAGD